MTTRKTTRTTTARRTPKKRTTAARRTPSRRRTTRRTTSVASTIGAGLGALVVTAVLNASWGVRIAVLAVVLLGGLLWILWSKRAELAAMAQSEPEVADEPADSPASGPQDATPPPAGPST